MLRRGLVERPAEWLSRLTPWRVAIALLSLAALAAAVHVFEGEGLKLAGASLGEAWVWFAAFDIGTLLEVSAAVWLLGAVRQVRAALGKVRDAVARMTDAVWRPARPPSPRARRPAPRRPQDKDPDPEGWPGLAVAA